MRIIRYNRKTRILSERSMVLTVHSVKTCLNQIDEKYIKIWTERKLHQNMDGTKIALKYGRNENCTKIWTEVSRMVVKATRVRFKFIFDYRIMYTATSL